jgi:hypothetical protein
MPLDSESVCILFTRHARLIYSVCYILYLRVFSWCIAILAFCNNHIPACLLSTPMLKFMDAQVRIELTKNSFAGCRLSSHPLCDLKLEQALVSKPLRYGTSLSFYNYSYIEATYIAACCIKKVACHDRHYEASGNFTRLLLLQGSRGGTDLLFSRRPLKII